MHVYIAESVYIECNQTLEAALHIAFAACPRAGAAIAYLYGALERVFSEAAPAVVRVDVDERRAYLGRLQTAAAELDGLAESAATEAEKRRDYRACAALLRQLCQRLADAPALDPADFAQK